MKNGLNFLLFLAILSSSASYNAMNTGYLSRFNPFAIITSLFRSAQIQPAIQAQNQAARQYVRKYPNPLPYAQHTQIRAPIRAHTLNRFEWEAAERETASSITEEDIRYSFEIWCKRLKADAYNTAQKQRMPDAFSIAPIENPELILVQLTIGSRPLIQNT